jgi:hypothetical protein
LTHCHALHDAAGPEISWLSTQKELVIPDLDW